MALTSKLTKKLSIFSQLACTFLLMACGRTDSLRPGDAVWVQWTPEVWYHGRIEAPCDRGFKVRLDDQDEKCSSLSELAKDITPTRTQIQEFSNLLCQKEDGQYYPCSLLRQDGLNFQVQFKNLELMNLPLKHLRIPADFSAKK